MNNDRAPDPKLLSGVAAVLGKEITTSDDGEQITVADKKEVTEKATFRVAFGCANMPLIVNTFKGENAAIGAVIFSLREGMEHITFDKTIEA